MKYDLRKGTFPEIAGHFSTERSERKYHCKKKNKKSVNIETRMFVFSLCNITHNSEIELFFSSKGRSKHFFFPFL